MSEHPHSALVRRGYEAFGEADRETLRSLLTADCVHHVPGRSRVSGHTRAGRTSWTSTGNSVNSPAAPCGSVSGVCTPTAAGT